MQCDKCGKTEHMFQGDVSHDEKGIGDWVEVLLCSICFKGMKSIKLKVLHKGQKVEDEYKIVQCKGLIKERAFALVRN